MGLSHSGMARQIIESDRPARGTHSDMFILIPRIGEVIRIGEDITLSIVKITGRLVTIEIDAPKELGIAAVDAALESVEFEDGPVLNTTLTRCRSK